MKNTKNTGADKMVTGTYKVTEDLMEKGWLYDDTGVYVPYTHKNEEFYDHRDVYLKIKKHPKISNHLVYIFGKMEEGLFYPAESYISPNLINEKDKKLTRTLSYMGKRYGLNAGDKVYVKFVKSFKNNINNADCLDILKVEDYEVPNEPNMVNLTVQYVKDSHHNFMNMFDLARLALGEPVYNYPYRKMYHCPFHDDARPSGEALYSVFRCLSKKKQYDQTELLMKHFDLDTPQEAEEKFQELLQ